ncbi:MAG: RDD family protein [Chloroflexi bacterium]|nr:RDD family protein [Chloroflexota bacterium]
MTVGQPGPSGQDPSSQPEGSTTPPPTWQSAPSQPAPSGGAPAAGNWTANLSSQAPVAGPAGYFYADVPNRIIAYIIDAIILIIITFIVTLVLGGILGGPSYFLITAVVNTAINGAYFVYTWTAMRATPGMKVLGMQLGDETDGRTITMNQAIIRWVLLGAPFGVASALSGFSILGLLILLAALVWFIVLLVTTAQSPTKQGIHDKYAKTIMVKAARSAA